MSNVDDDPFLLHERDAICTTRKRYRDGRRSTAVKVYTVNQESKYLLVQGVPSLGIHEELIKLFALYGPIIEYRILDDFPKDDKFTDVYWIQFKEINAARIAKRKMDDFSFYGSVLHVCYCPEYESPQDTRQKLQERRKAIAARVRKLKNEQGESSKLLEGRPQAASIRKPSTQTSASFMLETESEQFSVVPTVVYDEKQSTSVDYDLIPPRLPPPPMEYQQQNIRQSKQTNVRKKFSPWSLIDDYKSIQDEPATVQKPSQPQIKPSDVVVKTNNSQKFTAKPKFVPRQTIKKIRDSNIPVRSTKPDHSLDEEIRKNAFILGKRTGPQNKSHGSDSVLPSDTVQIDPMEETRLKIRERLKQFTDSKILQKRLKTS